MKKAIFVLKSIFSRGIDFINKSRETPKIVFNIMLYSAYILLSLISFFVLLLDEISPFNLILLALIIIFILISCIMIFTHGKLILTRQVVLYFSLILLVFMSCCFNVFASVQKSIFLIILFSAFLSMFLSQQFLNAKKIFLSILVSTWLVIAVFAFFERDGIIHPNFSNRIGYDFGDQNYVARDMSFCLIANFVGIFFYKNKLKWVLLLPVSLTLYFILLTGSISNLLAVLCSLSIVIGIYTRKKIRIIYIVSLIALIAAFFGLINLPFFSYFKLRIDGMISSFTGNGQNDPSFVNRFIVSRYGLSLWLSSPLFGSGYSAVYRNYFIMAHSNIVEVLADYGIFAFIVEEALLFIPVYYVLRRKSFNRNIRAIVLSFALYMIFLQPFLVEIDSKAEMIFLPLCYYFLNPTPLDSTSNYSEINAGYYELVI